MNADGKNSNQSLRETMDHRQIAEELPGYALGCLDPDASDRVTAHLAGCEACRRQLRSFEQTVGLLAFGVRQIEPPDTLKERLMRRVDRPRSVRSSPRPESARSLASFFEWFSPALATVCLVVIISLATVNFLQWRQSRTISNRLASPLTIFKMRGTPLAPHADGTFVIGHNPLHGVLVASDLPSVPPTQQFQLWLIRDGAQDNGGAFSTTPLGYGVMQVAASRPLSDYQSATVTVEPLGGSPSPTGPEMMSGAF